MLIKQIESLTTAVQKLFIYNGVNENQAAEVAGILVRTSMLGFNSHGLYRTGQYIDEINEKRIVVNAPVEVTLEKGAVAVVDGNWNFGQITANAAAKKAVQLAKKFGIALCTVKQSNHIGSLGFYTRLISEEGCAALGYCGTNGGGCWVAPYGVKQGFLATNPISFAAPTNELPVAMDFSTSMISEGKLRLLRDAGEKVPPNLAVDSNGVAVTDPKDYYGPPRGAILPFGESQGYKGTGLSVMCEVLSCLLGNGNWRPYTDDVDSRGNALTLIAIDISYLNEVRRFKNELSLYAAHLKNCTPLPGFTEITLPGDIENTTLKNSIQTGIDIDDFTYSMLRNLCDRYSVNCEF